MRRASEPLLKPTPTSSAGKPAPYVLSTPRRSFSVLSYCLGVRRQILRGASVGREQSRGAEPAASPPLPAADAAGMAPAPAAAFGCCQAGTDPSAGAHAASAQSSAA